MSKSKEQRFEDLIFKQWKDDNHYDQIKYEMLKARSLMFIHKAFNNATTQQQYDICLTICLINLHSALNQLDKSMPISKPKNRPLKYSLSQGFENPTIISLDKSIEAQ